MSSFQLGLDLVFTFLLAAALLFNYGNWYRHHVFVTLAVLIAWYFSFIIIFVLPLDVSATVYRQCLTLNTTINDTIIVGNETVKNSSIPLAPICEQPYSYSGQHVLPNLWRVVYWTSQCLTWLLLPMMQSYTQAGDFTIKGKLRSAVLDNAIYYGSYLFICAILLAYIAVKPELQLDFQKLKTIASSASNTWGLFLLVFMLGYGLVALPRNLWHSSFKNYSLSMSYFKLAKLAGERNSAEERLDDCLESLQSHLKSPTPALLKQLDEIALQIPTEFRERMKRRNVEPPLETHEKALVALNKALKKALKNYHRTETLWDLQITNTIHLEDVERNLKARDYRFKHTFPQEPSNFFCRSPFIEWWWKCVVVNYLLRFASISIAILSLMVIWSEATFFVRSPQLSLFALFISSAKEKYDYSAIEFVSTLTIAYLAVCAFYTVFKIRIFNFYYLAGSHQTDEYSLIFAGMLLCRLTPPLCLNFLGMIHMDSHVIKNTVAETSYTGIMGHMDVLSLISDGFNIYFPMGIFIIAGLTWFKVGARALSFIGFPQFLTDDEVSTDLVNEGQQLITREKRRRQRNEDSRRRNEGRRPYEPRRDAAREANRNIENVENLSSTSETALSSWGSGRAAYGTGYPPPSREQPPRGLFDDV